MCLEPSSGKSALSRRAICSGLQSVAPIGGRCLGVSPGTERRLARSSVHNGSFDLFVVALELIVATQ